MTYTEAEQKLFAGETKIRRLAWSGNAVLALDNNIPQLLDLDYGAYWDLTNEDKAATDWEG